MKTTIEQFGKKLSYPQFVYPTAVSHSSAFW